MLWSYFIYFQVDKHFTLPYAQFKNKIFKGIRNIGHLRSSYNMYVIKNILLEFSLIPYSLFTEGKFL